MIVRKWNRKCIKFHTRSLCCVVEGFCCGDSRCNCANVDGNIAEDIYMICEGAAHCNVPTAEVPKRR